MPSPAYLRPYLDAIQRHGAGFESLLWASPSSQAARFAALVRWCELAGRVIVDAGCGRADFLDYLHARGIRPARYIGIEAVEAFAQAAEVKNHPNFEIVRGDFIQQPALMDRGADVVIFSGSLNTVSVDQFYESLRSGWKFTRSELAFNFLCSPKLAFGDHLTWHGLPTVRKFAHDLTTDVAIDETYRDGDSTIVLRKSTS